MSGDAHLRISDADRDAVRAVLERAVGEGMLTLDEFSERLDAVLAARTRGELEPIVRDLPVARLTGEPGGGAGDEYRTGAAAGADEHGRAPRAVDGAAAHPAGHPNV